MSTGDVNRTLTPRKKIDNKYPFPEAYVSFNPSSFNDKLWSIRDLQKLCSSLGLNYPHTNEKTLNDEDKASYKQTLVEILHQWNKTELRKNPTHRRWKGTTNFALLQIDIPITDDPEELAKCNQKVSPRMLTPLKQRARRNPDGSPVSILKRQTPGRDGTPRRLTFGDEDENAAQQETKQTPKKRINFSLFNGTKIIPPKERVYHSWLAEAGVNPSDTSESEAEDVDDGFDSDVPEYDENKPPVRHDIDELTNTGFEQDEDAPATPVKAQSQAIQYTDNRTTLAEDDFLQNRNVKLPSQSPYAKQQQQQPIDQQTVIGASERMVGNPSTVVNPTTTSLRPRIADLNDTAYNSSHASQGGLSAQSAASRQRITATSSIAPSAPLLSSLKPLPADQTISSALGQNKAPDQSHLSARRVTRSGKVYGVDNEAVNNPKPRVLSRADPNKINARIADTNASQSKLGSKSSSDDPATPEYLTQGMNNLAL